MLIYFLLLDLHIILVFCFFYHILGMPHKSRFPRPKNWAKPLPSSALPNLWQVTPHIYRSAYPEKQSEKILRKLGIKKILCLCAKREGIPHFQDIETVHIPMQVKKPDTQKLQQAVAFLKTCDRKILVHCTHGADRTGLVIALYRIQIQGWDKKEALAEMLEGGYGFHIFWQQSVKYLNALEASSFPLHSTPPPSNP